jgi:hypothetical protein
LTAAAGRKFGLTVGLAFAALGSLLLWRGKPTGATVMLVLGALLIVAGLVAPTRLGPVERAWMRLAHLISKATTPIFMGVVYFLVLMPIGFIRRRNGSPLAPPAKSDSRWTTRLVDEARRTQMEHQY